MTDLFPGFEQRHMAGDGADIFLRLGGSGPPLLLLHGFPQTHAMWHRLAAPLAEHFTVVIPDLRGYGLSTGPEDEGDGYAYSKRAMGRDFLAVMAELGHEQFAVLGHDRGARVAYRMALDRGDSITRLGLLDIVPTYAMWHGMDHKIARAMYHWSFLAQPHPLPETLIGTNPVFYLDWSMASWTQAQDLSPFDGDALAAYRLHFAAPETIRATCDDYRSGATYDLAADEADRAAGRRIACPTLALWGTAGTIGAMDGPLAVWREWC
ncbi:MAG: alpha/beta fold hydrolase, partial [Hyphomicrobiales bacterium]